MRRPKFFIIAVVLVLILLAGCSVGKENTTINNTTGDVSDDFQGIEFDRNHLLPVGSIVTLKGYFKKVMICGIGTGLVTDEQCFYDYAGCYYPAGVSAQRSISCSTMMRSIKYTLWIRGRKDRSTREIMEM